MPFFHDGTFHLFYLFDRHHHGSKWGPGAHQYAQLSTQDLVHWEQQPLAVPIVRQWECSMGTCDCLWHDGLTACSTPIAAAAASICDKPQPGSWIFCRTSSDGIHFHKDLQAAGARRRLHRFSRSRHRPVPHGPRRRQPAGLQDLRHWEEIAGRFCRAQAGHQRRMSALVRLERLVLFHPRHQRHLEVAQCRWARGRRCSRRSTTACSCPRWPSSPAIGGFWPGFLFERGWAGHLAFRELIQYPDGSLGTKFPPELIRCGAPQRLPARSASIR